MVGRVRMGHRGSVDVAANEANLWPQRICREEGRVAPKGGRSRESKGSAGGGGVADEADESDATEEEATGGRTWTRVGRPRGGMKVAARIGEGLRREIERGRRPRVRVGDG